MFVYPVMYSISLESFVSIADSIVFVVLVLVLLCMEFSGFRYLPALVAISCLVFLDLFLLPPVAICHSVELSSLDEKSDESAGGKGKASGCVCAVVDIVVVRGEGVAGGFVVVIVSPTSLVLVFFVVILGVGIGLFVVGGDDSVLGAGVGVVWLGWFVLCCFSCISAYSFLTSCPYCGVGNNPGFCDFSCGCCCCCNFAADLHSFLRCASLPHV